MEHGHHEGGHHGEHAAHHEKDPRESFLGKHRAWLRGSLKDVLMKNTLNTLAAGTLLAAAGVVATPLVLSVLALPYTVALMMSGKEKAQSHGHEHGHAH